MQIVRLSVASSHASMRKSVVIKKTAGKLRTIVMMAGLLCGFAAQSSTGVPSYGSASCHQDGR
jgi:hypothetical protein